jgi:hypothetical protein
MITPSTSLNQETTLTDKTLLGPHVIVVHVTQKNPQQQHKHNGLGTTGSLT